MPAQQEQDLLLKIVETWRPNPIPEYRGFRCANCQQYKNQAWYHWLNTAGYRLPVHMCTDTCEPAFQNASITIAQDKRQTVDRPTFGQSYPYPSPAVQAFRNIVAAWPDAAPPQLKAFTCDLCHQDLDIDPQGSQRKGYHVWWLMDDGTTLAELHFHRHCAQQLEIESGK